jgi:hypothetical protein
MPTAEDDWMELLSEAHNIVKQWEGQRQGRSLSVADAALLAERIARALRQAFERGTQAQKQDS